MRRKSLLMVVALLAVASIMAAMAFNSGYVWNGQSLTIVQTTDALVALKPGTGVGNGDKTSYVKDNQLFMDFGKGKGGKIFGLQPGSRYTWDDLFEVKNNSKEDIEINISTDDILAKYAKFTGIVGDTSKVLYAKDSNPGWIRIPSGETAKIKVDVVMNYGTDLHETSGNSVVVNTRVYNKD